MNDRSAQSPPPPPSPIAGVNPDAMLAGFRGKPLALTVTLAVIFHVLFIGVFSIGYLKRRVVGDPAAAMTKEQRVDNALKESTIAIRKIAERYDLTVQDVARRIAGGPPAQAPSAEQTSPQPSPADAPAAQPPAGTTGEPATPPAGPPVSQIEKTLQHKEPGPSVPELGGPDDDMFAPKKP